MANARNDFSKGKRLQPAQVYYSIVGGFEANGFACQKVIFGDLGLEKKEIARIYQKDNQRYILYYPGKDNNEALTADKTTTPLKEIITNVKSKIKESQLNLADQEYKEAHQLFIVCQSNKYKLWDVEHFTVAHLHQGTLITEDSMKRNYNQDYVTEDLQPLIKHTTTKIIKRGWQKSDDTWQCGHYVIQAMLRIIRGETRNNSEKLKISDEILAEHSELYERGVACLAKDRSPEPEKKGDLISDYATSSKDILTEHSGLHERGVARLDKDCPPIPNDSMDGSQIFNEFFNEGKKQTQSKPSFFSRNPWARDILIGAGIGLVVVAAIAISAVTLGGGAIALGIGTAIGGFLGLNGTVAAGVGLGIISSAVTGLFGAGSGWLGLKIRSKSKPKPKPKNENSKITDNSSPSSNNTGIGGSPAKIKKIVDALANAKTNQKIMVEEPESAESSSEENSEKPQDEQDVTENNNTQSFSRKIK